jgi:hypothetical protein
MLYFVFLTRAFILLILTPRHISLQHHQRWK